EHLADSCSAAKHVFVLGRDDDRIWASKAEPAEWEPDENATATINYTSGTTARPKGVQQTHRARCVNATTLGAHRTLTDTDASRPGAPKAEPAEWEPDENATATINYTSGTTARPKGVQQTHRARWVNATTFGWHATLTDRDVYLHTLPMFHCDGWGLLYATTG